MAGHICPTCGKPTATEYLERGDSGFCSPFGSPDCWEVASGPVHFLVDFMPEETACGSDDGAGASSSKADVTCPECLARI